MDIQNSIFDHWKPLVLIAGIMMFILGIMPIVSRKYYEKYYRSTWDDKFWPFSKQDGYVYDRYIRPTSFVVIGFALVVFTLYKIFFS